MADWVTISALATAGGTLALAGATYGSVRSANRAARVAEQALQERRRPVLVDSRPDDPAQPVSYGDDYRMSVGGAAAAIEVTDDAVYLAASLRNVGSGLAVLQGWAAGELPGAEPGTGTPWRGSLADAPSPRIDDFRELTRDQYIPAGDLGVWQAAVRDRSDPLFAVGAEAATSGHGLSIDLLYTDQVGGQRTISRFGIRRLGGELTVASARHWYLDAEAPR